MKIKELIAAGLTGTTAMTFYSRLAVELEKQNILLPELLGLLLKDALPGGYKYNYLAAGWCVHYMLGIYWAGISRSAYAISKAKPGLITSLMFGVFSGITAVATWKLLFKLHPKPPQ